MKSIAFIIIAILLATNNVFINFKVGSISYDRLLEFVFFFLFIKSFIIEMDTNSYFKKYVLFIIVLAFLQLMINLKFVAFYNAESDVLLKNLIKCFSFIVFSYLFLMIAKDNVKYLNLIIIIHIGICVFAILQHPMSPFSAQVQEIKTLLYANVEMDEGITKRLKDQETYIELGIGNRFRLSGPFASSITFSYFLLSTFFLNIYMYFRSQKKIYLYSLAFIILCTLLCQTRSLFVAEVVIILGVFLFIHNQKLNSYKVILTIIALALSFTFLNKIEEAVTSSDASRLTNFSDKGSDRHLLWITGVYAIANHPFGITDDQYTSIKREMFMKFGASSILGLPSHNGFINVGFNYSILGYFIIILFFIFNYKYIKRLSKTFKILFLLFCTAYFIHSSFHNNFIFYSDYDVYMVLMLIPIQLLLEQNKDSNQEPNTLI